VADSQRYYTAAARRHNAEAADHRVADVTDVREERGFETCLESSNLV
jgi:hypothetical protein